jgi:hypothetical protein
MTIRPPRLSRRSPAPAALLLAIAASWPTGASAQTSPVLPEDGRWQFRGTLYLYVPTVDGTASVPADDTGPKLDLDAGAILDNLKFTVMGTLDARNGRWGVFTDFLYLSFGNTKEQSRDFSIGDIGLPVGTNAHLDWSLKGYMWTLAGEYALGYGSPLAIDAIAGARLLDIDQDINWNISGDIGPLSPAGRSGSFHSKPSNWDAIVGVKGRYALGSEGRWAVPFYVDVGAGQSQLTWQAAAGISYGFAWGELTGMWRHVAYEMKSGQSFDDLSFDGPMAGVTLRW